MPSFRIGKAGVCALLAITALASSARTGEIHIGENGQYPYETLDEFRMALEADPNLLAGGGVIILHNDSSLTDSLMLPNGVDVTIRGDNGAHTITRQPYAPGDPHFGAPLFYHDDYDDPAKAPRITLENIRVTGNEYGAAASIVTNNPNAAGRLEIRNSVFEGNNNHATGLVSGAANVFDHSEAFIVNTVIQNNNALSSGGITIATPALIGDATLNIVMDGGAPDTITWSGNTAGTFQAGAPNSVTARVGAGTTVNLNTSIAGGKAFNQKDPIYATLDDGATLNIAKTGAGTWKLDGMNYVVMNDTDDNIDDNIVTIDVREGRMHFKEDMYWAGVRIEEPNPADPLGEATVTVVNKGALNIGSGAVFKPSIYVPGRYAHTPPGGTPGFAAIPGAYATYLLLDSFNSGEGAKLEVGGISKLPRIGQSGEPGVYIESFSGTIAEVTHREASDMASPMEINNRLMHAWLSWGSEAVSGENTVALNVDRLANLSTLPGVGEGMDVYRKRDNLSEAERDWLDDIYARGGASQSDLGFIQTLNGDTVMLSQLAMRANLVNALKKIYRRASGFQDEELQIGSDGASAAERGRYDELWAYLDQVWMTQDAGDSMAGYDYRPTSLGIGYDRHDDQWIIGGLLSLDMGDVKLRSEGRTRTSTRTAVASLYASYATEGLYITGGLQAGYGWNKTTSHYEIVGLRADGDSGTYGVHMLGVNAEIGYMADIGGGGESLRVTPYTGLSYARIGREAFSESGAGQFNRQFNASRWNMFDWTLGVRVSKPMTAYGMTVIPSLDIAFARTAGSPGAKDREDAHFMDSPLGAWSIGTYDGNRNALRLGGGVAAKVRSNLDIGLDYDFEWRSRFTSHQFSLNMSLGF